MLYSLIFPLVFAIQAEAQKLQPVPEQAERTPIAAKEEGPAVRTAKAVDELQAALKAWRTAAEAGAPVSMAELNRMMNQARTLMEDVEVLHEMAQRAEREREARFEKKVPARPKVNASLKKGWKESMLALGEGADKKRTKAQVEMLGALKGDARERQAAMEALAEVGDVAFDKKPFAEIIRPLAVNSKGHEQVLAFHALHQTEPVASDLALLHKACEGAGPELKAASVRLLFLFGKGDFTSATSNKLLLEQLNHPVKKARISAVRGLWGAHLTDQAAGKIVKLIQEGDRDMRKDGVYYALSTLRPKNSVAVDYLLTELNAQHSNSGRSLWGLSYGVSPKDQERVAEAMLELHNARSSIKIRKRTRAIVEEYGSPDQIARLLK